MSRHNDEIVLVTARQFDQGTGGRSPKYFPLHVDIVAQQLGPDALQVTGRIGDQFCFEIAEVRMGEVDFIGIGPSDVDYPNKLHFQGKGLCQRLGVSKADSESGEPSRGTTTVETCSIALPMSGVIVSTGTCDEWSTLSVTLPRTPRVIMLRPCVAIAMRSEPCRSVALTISRGVASDGLDYDLDTAVR
jgi:hypothetical protein